MCQVGHRHHLFSPFNNPMSCYDFYFIVEETVA